MRETDATEMPRGLPGSATAVSLPAAKCTMNDFWLSTPGIGSHRPPLPSVLICCEPPVLCEPKPKLPVASFFQPAPLKCRTTVGPPSSSRLPLPIAYTLVGDRAMIPLTVGSFSSCFAGSSDLRLVPAHLLPL